MTDRETAGPAPEPAPSAGSAPAREATPESAPPLPSLPRRVVDVFFSPGRLFAALREEPRWGWALLLGAVVSGGALAVIPPELWVESIRAAMLESGQPVPDGFDPEGFGGVQKVFAIAATSVSWFLIAFVTAGVTALLFAFLMGDEGGYKQHLAVVSHALLIMAVGSALLTPLRLAQGDLQLSLNLGLFFPLEEGFAARYLRFLDLFWLWTFVVIGIGVHQIDRRRSVGTAVTVVLALPLALALLQAALTGG